MKRKVLYLTTYLKKLKKYLHNKFNIVILQYKNTL